MGGTVIAKIVATDLRQIRLSAAERRKDRIRKVAEGRKRGGEWIRSAQPCDIANKILYGLKKSPIFHRFSTYPTYFERTEADYARQLDWHMCAKIILQHPEMIGKIMGEMVKIKYPIICDIYSIPNDFTSLSSLSSINNYGREWYKEDYEMRKKICFNMEMGYFFRYAFRVLKEKLGAAEGRNKFIAGINSIPNDVFREHLDSILGVSGAMIVNGEIYNCDARSDEYNNVYKKLYPLDIALIISKLSDEKDKIILEEYKSKGESIYTTLLNELQGVINKRNARKAEA